MSSISDPAFIRSIFDQEELAFRDEVDALLRAGPTPERGFYEGRGGETRALYKRFGERGWLSLGWPTRFGGRAKPPAFDYLLWDTAAFHRAARPDLGPGIVAHALTTHGTDDQRTRYLPGLAAGATCFALGYSEPEAGSDLTGLRTRAIAEPDRYIVSGEKCWTSDAHHADYLWLLCRTGTIEERAKGLTLLILDLHAAGVTITPIETIDGHRLNQVFLDAVEVPAEDRVGAEGAAWTIIREALAVERHLQLLPGRLRRDLGDLADLVERTGHGRDPVARAAIADMAARVQQVEASSLRTVAELTAGRPGVAEAARTKLLGTRLAQEVPRLAFELCGAPVVDAEEPLAFLWRQSIMETVGGGTNEVMLSILARDSLGLGART